MAKPYSPLHGRKKHSASAKEDLSGTAAGQLSGLVVSNYGQSLDVEDHTGKIFRCTTRKKISPLVCGDKVLWLPTTAEEGVIVALQTRQSLLVRPDSHGTLKPVAANVDQLIVTTTPRTADIAAGTAADTLIDTSLIDRYLVAAELSRIHAIIVINKADLLPHEALANLTRHMEVYQTIGYKVLFTRAKEVRGADELIESLKDHVSVFCGPSGVGKSSLVKAVLPDQEIRIGEVSAATGGGRHTTTLTTLYHLPRGGSLIDSPGVRDFGLWHVDTGQIAQGFVEFRHHASSCRFANCSHLTEPGCAVQHAVQKGVINANRLASYRRIVASLQH